MAADSWTSTLGLSCMALAAGAVLGYSLFIDAGGIVISGQVLRKSETISVNEGSWSRRLSVTVRYQPAGEPRASEVSGNVDAETFDRLHTGSPVAVRYLPWGDLRRVPLLKRARFADQSTFWISKDWYRPLWEAAEVLGGIILLIVLWRKAHINAAGWLLLPAIPLLILCYTMPSAENEPMGEQRTVRATVKSVTEVTQVLETSESPGIDTRQPFQIVELQFVPEGKTDPVAGVDKVDSGSIPVLAPGRQIDVRYQVDRPRIMRIAGGTRTFPREALVSVAKAGGEWLVGIAILLGVCALLGSVLDNVKARCLAMIEQIRRARSG